MKQPAPKHKHFHNLAYICREIAHRDDFLFFSAMDRDATLSAFEASELWLPDREIWPDSDSGVLPGVPAVVSRVQKGGIFFVVAFFWRSLLPKSARTEKN